MADVFLVIGDLQSAIMDENCPVALPLGIVLLNKS